MPRHPLAPELKAINFSVKLPRNDMTYLDHLKDILGKPAIADVVREIVEACRTMFSLPDYQVDLLRYDMQRRRLNLIQYIREALARRYEELSRTPPSASTDNEH